MKTMTIECPEKLAMELDGFVKQGWAASTGEAVVEALRRFLESHNPEVIRSQVQSDVMWGLEGDD
jgi:metal-responsive CopG/Arc/MetJ family transcriptional regulator